jgi:RNA polymerase sigma factor (sigma-70 family)
MSTSPLTSVIQHLLADARPDGCGKTDGELWARFLSRRDDAALATLLRRHAPMVWGVCCRLLRNHHDAEDAFQATFLVLVRKAADVPGQAVANWLFGVARQTSVRLRATAAKRRRRETQVVNMPEPTAAEARDTELRSALDEELSRLPEHYRGVVILCDLEGLTRREAARQLGIPEGSAASRLARGRVLLAKRLTRRGVVLSGGSVAAVLSAASASASAPPALVASTIEAASLLAAGRTVGIVSAKVAALTEGMVNAMLVSKVKGVLMVVLVVAALLGATGLTYLTQAAEPPKTNEPKLIGDERARTVEPPKGAPSQAAQSDRERMVGNWFITNDDSGRRKGEMWVITEDSILMNAKDGGANAQVYSHRLDAGKSPKQIDISVIAYNGPNPALGTIKGIYVLDGDELRLCLGARGQGRPAAFPEKPGPGELIIFQRAPSGATPPKPKTDQERMVGRWVIANDDSGRKGEIWRIGMDEIVMHPDLRGLRILKHFHRLDATKNPKQIDITVKKMNDEFVGAIKGIYVLDGDELRLCLDQVGKERPTAFPEKPKPGEVLILHRDSPRVEQPKNYQNKVLTPEEAIKLRSKENVTVKFKVTAVQDMSTSPGAGFGTNFILLKDGGNFAVQLVPPAMDTIMRLGIEPQKHFVGKLVRVTGLVVSGGGGSFQIRVNDLAQFQVVME